MHAAPLPPQLLPRLNLASFIDHTALKPTVTTAEVDLLCREAADARFAAVCVPPTSVPAASAQLSDTGVGIATVIGFPLGYNTMLVKKAEAEEALTSGATELDVVQNLSALKSGNWTVLEAEAGALLDITRAAGALLKIILETGVLTEEEIVRCCGLYGYVGVDFVKTSTGFNGIGATPDVVRLMRAHLPAAVRIKAAGGIRTFAAARALVEAGAARIGTSAGMAILSD